jgi:ABC-type Na+ efflux pump permease subunit
MRPLLRVILAMVSPQDNVVMKTAPASAVSVIVRAVWAAGMAAVGL